MGANIKKNSESHENYTKTVQLDSDEMQKIRYENMMSNIYDLSSYIVTTLQVIDMLIGQTDDKFIKSFLLAKKYAYEDILERVNKI